MPDIDIFQQPKPVGNIPIIPQQQPQQMRAPVTGLSQLQVKQPDWLKTVDATIPYKTQLDQTLRYTDPELGYNPFDFEQEYKYADAHPYLTFGNNVLKGGAKLLGTFAEAFATIPLAINAASNKDFSKLYDNDLTNSLQDWYDSLEVSLPTYKNKNQTEHPILSWFSTDIFNNIGGAVNNLGFTAGAILGTIAEGAVITALTGGTGTLPAVGANLTRFFGKLGRTVAVGAESATELGALARQATQLAPEVANLERGLIQAGRSLAPVEVGVARHIGTGVPNEFIAGANATRNATVQSIDKGLNTLFNVTKVTDAIRYNLSLLTSATAEGAFEANSVLRNTEKMAKDKFFADNGYDATDTDLKNIQSLSKDAANFTMGANMAILYASNRINWGSLFKPTEKTVIASMDKGLFSTYKKFAKTFNKEKGIYELLDKTPTSRLGKSLLFLSSPTRAVKQSLVESLEEGSQFTVSEGATDYAMRKFDGRNRGELADYIKSFNYGVNQTFNTNEGLENLVGGFVGGIFGGFMQRGVNAAKGIKHIKAKDRLQQQIDGLNEQTFKGVFAHNIETAAVQQSLGKDYTAALKSGDLFTAKNIKAEMLHNWVNGAVKTNSFDARLDEIEAAKNLEAGEFSKMWGGLEYTNENRQEAVTYLEKIQQKAKQVKKDIEKVDRLFRGNPFNAKTQQADYAAHETWKEQLALNLGLSRNYQERSKQLEQDINRLIPGLNINQAIKLASKTGISDMLGKISTSIDNLAKLESETELVSPELAKSHRDKRNKLQQLFNELQPQVLDKFEAKTFIPTLRKLYNLTSGISLEANKHVDSQKLIGQEGVIYIDAQEQEINDDEVVSVFEQLMDMNKLHDANYKAVYSYNSLLKPRGAKGYATYVKNIIDKTNKNITITDDGKVETIIDAEREAEEEAKFQTQYMPEEEMSKEERQAMNEVILKEAAGETLTEEEEELLNKNPLYTEKKKTEQAIKEAKLNEKLGKETKNPEQVIEKNYITDESGFRKEVSPVELLNKINSDKKVGKDANTNLFKAIFSKVNNFLNSKITAKLAASDYATEKAQNGNVKQKYTPITLFDSKGNKTGVSGIYKARYERNIEIYHNNALIGLLKPADSLFLDENGTRTIYEMTEAEFTAVTGMPRTEYKAYMKELNVYKKAYDGLLAELEIDKGTVENSTVLKYFPDIKVNTGNTIFNKGEAKEQDTLIKDLQYQPDGTALLSYKNEGGYRKATIVNERELASKYPAYFNKLKTFINSEAFKTQIQRTEGRYVLALPINGEYALKSLLFSRPAEINEPYKKTLLSILGNNVGNELTAEEVETINNNIANTFYIANADRSVKGTNFELTINEDGSLSLQIKNREQKTAYNNTINIENPVIKTYEDIITLLQKTINDQERLDRNLQKLNIVIKEDSIKFQILNDADVFSLKEVEDKIKVASRPEVFENFSVNVYPKGSTKGEQKENKTKPKEPTPQEKQSLIDKIKNIKAGGRITTIDVDMAQADPEGFLEFIADQAYGVTTDPLGNKMLDSSGGNEASLIDTFGAEIVNGAKAMFPITEVQQPILPKTELEIQQEKEKAERDLFENKIENEYNAKKEKLHTNFINNLTEAEVKIRDFIKNNTTFVGREVVDVEADIAQGAGVTTTDVINYVNNVKIYNQQRNKLTEIAASKKQSISNGSTTETIKSKTVAETSIILQDLFNLPKDQADATAQVYERNRTAWVDRKYSAELEYRKNNKTSSPEYSLQLSDKVATQIKNKIEDFKEQQETTNDNGRRMIIQAKIEEQEAKLNNNSKQLYGVDLLDYINKQSYERFSFGKISEQELNSQMLEQSTTTEDIIKILETNKIIDTNCK
jgi:hypothetical protein